MRYVVFAAPHFSLPEPQKTAIRRRVPGAEVAFASPTTSPTTLTQLLEGADVAVFLLHQLDCDSPEAVGHAIRRAWQLRVASEIAHVPRLALFAPTHRGIGSPMTTAYQLIRTLFDESSVPRLDLQNRKADPSRAGRTSWTRALRSLLGRRLSERRPRNPVEELVNAVRAQTSGKCLPA